MAGDENTRIRGLTTPDGRTYLEKLPASIPADEVLVHNSVQPSVDATDDPPASHRRVRLRLGA